MKTYNWTTAKGAKVELTIEERTYTETLADGGYEREGKIKEAAEIKVNGNKVDNPRLALNGETVYFEIGGRNAETEIPKEIREQIWKEERQAARARDAAEATAEKRYQDGKEAIERAMQE